MLVNFYMRGQQEIDFFIRGSVIMHYGLVFWPETIVYGFITNTQLFTSQYINWWTGVVWTTCGLLWCFYQRFGLSFWRHPFTAEDPLVSKWRNATFLQICSDEETNSSTSQMTQGRGGGWISTFSIVMKYNTIKYFTSLTQHFSYLLHFVSYFVHVDKIIWKLQ